MLRKFDFIKNMCRAWLTVKKKSKCPQLGPGMILE